MKALRRIHRTLSVLLMMNLLFILHNMDGGFVPGIFLKIGLSLIVMVNYIIFEIFPLYKKGMSSRINALFGGYELILTSIYALIAEIAGFFVYIKRHMASGSDIDSGFVKRIILFAVFAWIFLLVHYLNGFWRTAFCSSQLGVGLRVLMFFFWWIFPVNVVLFLKWCKIVRREIYFEESKYLLDLTRVENQICRTKYPVVMVHGIFFRDWQYLNYWGRIPAALKKNGAVVFYGKQQSSRSVADSALEIKSEILRVLKETGAEKVNVVAHSKGGLDTRYAISCLGMDEAVASLTTINTPHRGCHFADVLLESFPNWAKNFVAGRYNSVFRKLGDASPDFLAGVYDLTESNCKAFNEKVPDSPKVYYQSSMSVMGSFFSWGFPLNMLYLLIKHYEGPNDGLVSSKSAVWGNYLGLVTSKKHGISHADMIDLTHKNIYDFDVSEFYVQILAGLKKMGF